MYKLSSLDPRTKIVIVIAVSTAAMAVGNILFLAGLFVFTELLMLLGGIGLAAQIRQARGAVGIVVFLFVLQALFGRWILGAMLCIRLLTVIMSALILMTGEVRDYLLGLVQMKIPYEIAYMVLIGLHFFPLLKEEAMDVYYSIQLRGVEVRKAPLPEKLRLYARICFPVLAGALSRTKDMSISMETRRFRAFSRRTYMRKLVLRRADKILMIVFPLLCAAFIAAGCGAFSRAPSAAAASPGNVPSGIILTWTGDPASTQTVNWQGSGGDEYVRYASVTAFRAYGKFTSETKGKAVKITSGDYYRYSAELTGLKKDTEYVYSVGAGGRWSGRHSFRTETGGTFSFMSLGDVQYQLRDRDYGLWGDMISSAYKKNGDIRFALSMGDMVDKNADIRDWKAFFRNADDVFAGIPLMPTSGNHEISVTPYTYKQMFDLPENGPSGLEEEVYSFDYGSCHFVSLNSGMFMDERRLAMGDKSWNAMIRKTDAWLANDLQKSTAKYKIVYMHHPSYPVAEDKPNVKLYRNIRKNWVPIFEDTGVKLVLNGHQHVYMRTKKISGIIYMTADSGQKISRYFRSGDSIPSYVQKLSTVNSTYEIDKVGADNMQVTAYDADGKKVDEFTVQ